MKQLLIEVDDETARRLEAVAPGKARMRSQFVREAIRRSLDALAGERPQILHHTPRGMGRDAGGKPHPDARATRFVLGGEELFVLSVPLGSGGAVAALTPAERDVATLVASGAKNAEIARRRGTSVRTVANQLASIYRKLGVSSRAELVRKLSGLVAATSGP